MSSYAGYNIKKSIEILLNYKKSINDKTEIERIKVRLNSELSFMQKATKELLSILSSKYGIVERDTIESLLENIEIGLYKTQSLTSAEEAKKIIDSYKEFLNYEFDHIPNSEFIFGFT